MPGAVGLIVALNYDGLRFGPDEVEAGSVVGHYHQDGDVVTAEFGGDRVRTGRLVGLVDADGKIDAAYCQIMATGELVSGRCVSTPQVLADGRIRLTESWHRIDGSSGISHITELRLEPANHDVIEGSTL